jgi:hypothetical protein
MSIYATLAQIAVKRFGDTGLVEIFVQGVPPHIDCTGSAWEFLPPPVDPEGDLMRAVFFVEPRDEKGTERCGQEYVKPLLMMTGAEYERTPFPEVLERLERALDTRYGRRPGAVFIDPDGTRQNLY